MQRDAYTSPTSKQRKHRKSDLALKSYTPLKDNELITQVGRSAGPEYPTGKPLGDSPNPSWPNEGQAWANEFTPRMTAALVNAINLGMHQIFERVKDALADQTKSVKMLRDDVLTEQQAGQVPTRRTLVVRCQVFALPLAELSGIATRGCGGRDGV